jgi:hypothetical protein
VIKKSCIFYVRLTELIFLWKQHVLQVVNYKKVFYILNTLYIYFAGSTKRFQSLTEELETIENSLCLKNLSQIRWTARAETIKAVWIAFENIVQVLERIKINIIDFDTKSRAVASGLLKNILHFDFICSLYFMKKCHVYNKNLTKSLESEELNVVDAMKMIHRNSF